MSRMPLEYGVYARISFSSIFNNEPFEDMVEYAFPKKYCPEMTYETKRTMYINFIFDLMKDTSGWLENVMIGQLRDESLKNQYIEYYTSKGIPIDYVLSHCPAVQPNLDNIPRTLAYKPVSYTRLFTVDIVNDFMYFYYNRRYKAKYGVNPIFLPKEPINYFTDMLNNMLRNAVNTYKQHQKQKKKKR